MVGMVRTLRTFRPGHLAFLVALTLFGLAQAQSGVRIARTSPAVKEAAPGATVTHVFRLEGEGRVRVEPRSELGWPLLTPARTFVLQPGRAAFYPVTLRVPATARAGERDRLVVTAAGASAEAYTVAAYRPGLEVVRPERAHYLPPVAWFTLTLKNTGNGDDAALVRLETLQGLPVYHARVPLAAGEEKNLRLPLENADTLRLRVRLERGGLERSDVLPVDFAPQKTDGGFRLIGRLGAAYSYPRAVSFSIGAAGPLSDFVQFRLGAGYALGGSPAGTLGFSWKQGYLSASFGPSYGVALGLYEGAVSTQLSLSGPQLRGGLNLDVNGSGYGLGAAAVLDDRPSLRLYGDVNTGQAAQGAAFQPGTLRFELAARPLETAYEANLGYGFGWRDVSLNLDLHAAGRPGAPVRFGLGADANPVAFSLGGNVGWTGLGLEDWSLAAASSTDRLGLDASLPVAFGARAGPGRASAFASARLDLPAPWSSLTGEARAEYRGGSWAFSLAGGSQASTADGLALLDLGGRVGWPPELNELAFGVRAGSSLVRMRADLKWAPWKPGLSTGVTLELPTGGALLRAQARRAWYAGRTTLGLSADVPVVLEVPEAVTRFFGGRNAGWVEGVVSLEGPERLRKGLVVRADGREAVTDAAGRFRLQLPPGRYTVRIAEDRLPAVLFPLEPEAQVEVRPKRGVHVELRVAARALLVGRVRVEAEPGRELPPERFAVEVGDPRGRTTSLFTQADGSFQLPGLPPGRYAVRLMEELLPPGWKALEREAVVELAAGEVAHVELTVRPPARKVYRGAAVQILSVKPEADTVPPGAAPLVEVRLAGEARRVFVTYMDRLLGVLLPSAEDPQLWRGRVRIPASASGTLPLVVHAQNGREVRFPFFLNVSPSAPWGVVRTPPAARPGQTLPLAVHWYAPVEASWVEVAGASYPLAGEGPDWRGEWTVPADAHDRLAFRVIARLGDGREAAVERVLLVRNR